MKNSVKHMIGILSVWGLALESYSKSSTASVMFVGELMKLSESYLADGLHPRLIAEALSEGTI